MVRKYFLDTYGFDPPIINRDQIPMHKNESAGQKALSLKSEATFVKKNYMLPRERVTCFTQLFRDHQIKLHPEFVFKGNGTRIHPIFLADVNYQWVPKGLNRIEQMLGLIKQLPYCFNMFTENISDLLFMYWMIMQCVLMSRIQKELYMDIFLPSLAGYHC